MSERASDAAAEWVPTLAVEAIDPEYPSMVSVGDIEVALCRADDGVFAVGNICSHAYARLSDGHIEGGEIFCPLHMGSFDFRTGEAVASPCYEPIASYPARIEGGTVFVCPVARPAHS